LCSNMYTWILFQGDVSHTLHFNTLYLPSMPVFHVPHDSLHPLSRTFTYHLCQRSLRSSKFTTSGITYFYLPSMPVFHVPHDSLHPLSCTFTYHLCQRTLRSSQFSTSVIIYFYLPSMPVFHVPHNSLHSYHLPVSQRSSLS